MKTRGIIDTIPHYQIHRAAVLNEGQFTKCLSENSPQSKRIYETQMWNRLFSPLTIFIGNPHCKPRREGGIIWEGTFQKTTLLWNLQSFLIRQTLLSYKSRSHMGYNSNIKNYCWIVFSFWWKKKYRLKPPYTQNPLISELGRDRGNHFKLLFDLKKLVAILN